MATPRKVNVEELLRLREAGLNGPQIAERLGVSAFAVRWWCRKLGCRLPGPRNTVKATVEPWKRYGRLVATDVVRRERGRLVWECRCDCGRTVPVSAALLLAGKTSSCGCLRREESAKRCAVLGRRSKGRPKTRPVSRPETV